MSHDLYKRKINNQNTYERVNDFESFPRLTQVSASTDLSLSGNKFDYKKPHKMIPLLILMKN